MTFLVIDECERCGAKIIYFDDQPRALCWKYSGGRK
jgi:hypothetical protein